jgi:hypothetical protein
MFELNCVKSAMNAASKRVLTDGGTIGITMKRGERINNDKDYRHIWLE